MFAHMSTPPRQNPIRDIAPLLLDEKQRLKPVPASLLAQTTVLERASFGVRHGVYGLLTDELILWLQRFISGRSAIEIGAGHGRLAATLGIPATDNRQQEDPPLRAYYALLGQAVVRYGENVEKLAAEEAVKKYSPSVVVASWVTHRFDPSREASGGNAEGVREEFIVANCDAYVFIGNKQVHANKSIWSLKHDLITPPWLYSRAHNGSPDFIAVWSR